MLKSVLIYYKCAATDTFNFPLVLCKLAKSLLFILLIKDIGSNFIMGHSRYFALIVRQ